jgi:hypothetical protein
MVIVMAQVVRAVGFGGLFVVFVALWTVGAWQTIRSLRRERQILATPIEVLAVEYRSDEVAVSRVADARRARTRAVGALIVTTPLCAFVALILVAITIATLTSH